MIMLVNFCRFLNEEGLGKFLMACTLAGKGMMPQSSMWWLRKSMADFPKKHFFGLMMIP